jgi:hypothetical protein
MLKIDRYTACCKSIGIQHASVTVKIDRYTAC